MITVPVKIHLGSTDMELSREAYKIIITYEDDHVRTHLLNAISDMFTCLAYLGMPPHNNDTERCIRNGIIPGLFPNSAI